MKKIKVLKQGHLPEGDDGCFEEHDRPARPGKMEGDRWKLNHKNKEQLKQERKKRYQRKHRDDIEW